MTEIGDAGGVQDLQRRPSLRASSGKSSIVGLENELQKILNWVTGNALKLNTLSIVGMPGIGKTTIAKTVYDHVDIQGYFDIRGWVTVSQNYSEHKVLLDLLDSMKEPTDQLQRAETNELKQKVYQKLKERRYFIILDDVWDEETGNNAKRLFPNDRMRSRIILTTRLKKVADHVNSDDTLSMPLLDEHESWMLFSKTVFGEDPCPDELKQIGTKIASNCKGLPLSIVLIGGLLSKADRTESYWEEVAQNLTYVITSNYDQCLKILDLSYENLPHYLKLCFLYMGIFPEDYETLASKLIKLWIAEGFITPETDKSLEDVAEEYLKNLVERSLILVSKHSSRGKIKTCKIHDLLRELSLKKATADSFFHVTDGSLQGLPKDISTSHVTDTSLQSLPKDFISLRRVGIHPSKTDRGNAQSLPASTVRSVLNFDPTLDLSVEFLNSRLLRVLEIANASTFNFPTEMVKLVNLRYLACTSWASEFPSAIDKLGNLQTLIILCAGEPFQLPLDMWMMPQLRHVQLDRVKLSDPDKAEVILKELQTLATVINFRCTDDIIGRIPNVKKLGLLYDIVREDWSDYYLNNLARLQKLEELKCLFNWRYPSFLQKLKFPASLKKLTLRGCRLPWENIGIIGSLPNLQVLKLKRNAFNGPLWKTKEEQFLQLKYLLLGESNLEDWIVESEHFPMLQQLILYNCQCLKEVPGSIGCILTLERIELYYCSDLVGTSAKQIQEEQRENGYEHLQVRNMQIDNSDQTS